MIFRGRIVEKSYLFILFWQGYLRHTPTLKNFNKFPVYFPLSCKELRRLILRKLEPRSKTFLNVFMLGLIFQEINLKNLFCLRLAIFEDFSTKGIRCVLFGGQLKKDYTRWGMFLLSQPLLLFPAYFYPRLIENFISDLIRNCFNFLKNDHQLRRIFN